MDDIDGWWSESVERVEVRYCVTLRLRRGGDNEGRLVGIVGVGVGQCLTGQ